MALMSCTPSVRCSTKSPWWDPLRDVDELAQQGLTCLHRRGRHRLCPPRLGFAKTVVLLVATWPTLSGRYRAEVDTFRTLTAAVAKDGDWYVARCLEVEVTSQGATLDEALANLREALELFFDDDIVPATFDHPLVTPIEIRIPA